MRNMLIVLDSDLVITGINAAARAYLSVSERDAVGRPLDAIMPEARSMLLADAAARVRDTGVGETFDLESGLFANRRLQDRKSVVEGRGVSVRGDIGGSLCIKKKK